MQGKYTNPLKYLAARLSRIPLRTAIRPLVRWSPLLEPRDGYTVIIGCSTQLVGMLGVNLRMVAAQRRENLAEVIIVFDRRRSEAHAALEARLRQDHPDLPVRFLYYSLAQERVARIIRWGWVYSWMSWCKGIAQTTTRYAVLHDFDAILIRPDVLEERYTEIRRRGHEFIGVRNYEGNGVQASDNLVTTFELIFDAVFVRRTFRPIEIFNHVTTFNGRTVDFDTFLYAESRYGTRSVLPVHEEDMVHPSQMICQYVDHQNGRLPAIEPNNLLLIPYFMYLSGDPNPLRRQFRDLRQRRGRSVLCFDRPADLSRLSASHAAWLTKQSLRLERAIAGEPREEVRSYFEEIEAMVADFGRAAEPSKAPVGAVAGSTN